MKAYGLAQSHSRLATGCQIGVGQRLVTPAIEIEAKGVLVHWLDRHQAHAEFAFEEGLGRIQVGHAQGDMSKRGLGGNGMAIGSRGVMPLKPLLQQFDDEAVGVDEFGHIADIEELEGVGDLCTTGAQIRHGSVEITQRDADLQKKSCCLGLWRAEAVAWNVRQHCVASKPKVGSFTLQRSACPASQRKTQSGLRRTLRAGNAL